MNKKSGSINKSYSFHVNARVFTTLVLLLCLLLNSCSRLPHPESPRYNSTNATTNVPIQVLHTTDQGLLPLIPITIAGQTHWWLLDTGSSHNLISQQLVSTLSLPVVSSSVIATIGGRRSTTHHRLPMLNIGNLKLDGQSASMIELNNLAKPRSLQIAGILGIPAIQQLVVTLDFRRKIARFSDLPITGHSNYTAVPFRIEGGTPVATLSFPGMGSGKFLLDTGNATALTLLPKYTRLRVPNHLAFIEDSDLGGGIPTRLAMLPEFRLAKNTFQQIPASLPLQNQRFDGVDGSIGNRLLGKQTIIFDFPGQKLLLEANPSTTRLQGSFGFLLAADNIVQTVLPNSPAQQSGMLPGDKIVAVNGHIPGANAHEIWKILFNRNSANISVLRNGNAETMTLMRAFHLPRLN